MKCEKKRNSKGTTHKIVEQTILSNIQKFINKKIFNRPKIHPRIDLSNCITIFKRNKLL